MNIQNKKPNRFSDFYDEAFSAFVKPDDGLKPLRIQKPKLFSSHRFWFALVVVVPTLFTAIYFTLFAADQYLTQAQFVVRTQDKQATPNFSSLLKGGSGNGGSAGRSEDDTYAVQEFIMSRDAVALLERNNNLRSILDRPEADPLARFPRPFGSNSFEQLFKAYPRFADVSYDTESGVSTLKVRAFEAKDAHDIAEALLTYSEQLVNRMSDRAEHDTIDIAKREVTAAEKRVMDAQLKIKDFRNREVMLDPTENGKGQFELVAKLAETAALAKAQLLQLQRTSPNSPQIGVLKDQIAGLESQIDKEQAKVAGAATSMAPKVTEYEQLELEKGFANQDLEAAHQLLQTAHLEAEQQHLYLETIVQPNTADYALYPKRLTIITTVLGVTLLLYGLGWLMVTGAKEHIH